MNTRASMKVFPAPPGRDSTAQGNALGNVMRKVFRPEGAEPSCFALSGLGEIRGVSPRALPWAVESSAFSAAPGIRRGEAAFTMAEIAIALGVIAFALIAIIGILPTGLQTQRDNREETIVNQDARLLVEAIKSGGRDVTSDIGAFVVSTNDVNGVRVPVNGISIADLLQLFSDPANSHTITFSAISGAIASRGCILSFRYQVASSVTPQVGNANEFFGTVLSNQVHEVRLRFAWPVRPDGSLGSEANRYTVRTLISGWHTNGVFYAQEYLNRPAP